MDASNASLPEGARRDVCLIPVTLAHARDAGRPVLVRGQGTRSRQAVRDLVGRGDIGCKRQFRSVTKSRFTVLQIGRAGQGG